MRQLFLCCCLLESLFCIAQTDTTTVVGKDTTRLKYELRTLYTTQKAGRLVDLTDSTYNLLSVDKQTNTLLISVVADRDPDLLRVQLEQAGIAIVSSYGRIVTCWVTPAQLAIVNTLPGCRWAQPVYRPRHRASRPPIGGNVIGQSDAALRADILRQQTGLTGAGVKIGVLSDSYNALGGAPAGVRADELPGTGNPNNFVTPVSVLRDYTAFDASDEGRAMLELIHDTSPGAALYFYTAYESQTGFATGIQALADAGCRVIIDDIGYFDEPFFQDGIVAQAVDQVKATKGVTYFSAAGNSGSISYENAYQSSTYQPFTGTANNQITAHNFAASGQPAEYYLPITLAPGAQLLLGFQWSEPFASVIPAGSPSMVGANTDMDIYLLRSKPTGPISAGSATIVARSTDDNVNADPLEILSYSNPGNTTTTTFYLLITRFSASGNPARLKVIGFTDFGFPPSASALPGINAGTAYGHPNASGAIAVGAASYDDTPAFGRTPPVLEYYSSKGGIPVYFRPDGSAYPTPIVRQKPEIVASDNVNTSFFGYDYENDGAPNFAGTSAAAPCAGAVAGLLLQGRPQLTPDRVKTALQTTTIDMDDPGTPGFDTGFDLATGYGLVQADRAYQAASGGVCSTLGSGSWNDPATWSGGVVPGLTDEVRIGAGHVITIVGFTARAAKIQYAGSGRLLFQNNGRLSFAP